MSFLTNPLVSHLLALVLGAGAGYGWRAKIAADLAKVAAAASKEAAKL